jgi:hypothetical protein
LRRRALLRQVRHSGLLCAARHYATGKRKYEKSQRKKATFHGASKSITSIAELSISVGIVLLSTYT